MEGRRSRPIDWRGKCDVRRYAASPARHVSVSPSSLEGRAARRPALDDIGPGSYRDSADVADVRVVETKLSPSPVARRRLGAAASPSPGSRKADWAPQLHLATHSTARQRRGGTCAPRAARTLPRFHGAAGARPRGRRSRARVYAQVPSSLLAVRPFGLSNQRDDDEGLRRSARPHDHELLKPDLPRGNRAATVP